MFRVIWELGGRYMTPFLISVVFIFAALLLFFRAPLVPFEEMLNLNTLVLFGDWPDRVSGAKASYLLPISTDHTSQAQGEWGLLKQRGSPAALHVTLLWLPYSPDFQSTLYTVSRGQILKCKSDRTPPLLKNPSITTFVQNKIKIRCPTLALKILWDPASLSSLHFMLRPNYWRSTPCFFFAPVPLLSFQLLGLSFLPLLAWLNPAHSYKHMISCHLLQETFWRSSYYELSVSCLCSLPFVPCAYP